MRYLSGIARLKIFIVHLRWQNAGERVKAGVERTRAVGTKSGRTISWPPVVLDRVRLAELRNAGESWRTIAAQLGVSAGTVRRAYSQTAVSKPPSNKLRRRQ